MEEGGPNTPEVDLGWEGILAVRVDQCSLVHARVKVLLCPVQGNEGFLGTKFPRCPKVCQLEDVAEGLNTKLCNSCMSLEI